MSNDGKVKIYKNPARNVPEARKPYVPQYQIMGVSPEEYKSPLAPGYNVGKVAMAKPSTVNPRAPRAVIQQPYAEAVTSPIGRGRGLIPNVGNNMEQTWSGVDGEITDDISDVDLTQPMIDNNDFVNDSAFGHGVVSSEIEQSPQEFEEEPPVEEDAPKNFLSGDVLQTALQDEYLTTLVKQLDEEEFLLLVDGSAICSGPMDFIQDQTRALVFGEHELYHGNPVSIDDIVVLKRVKIKVGVFLG
jgi:hypothetical protein